MVRDLVYRSPCAGRILGGDLVVSSVVGQGSVFTFTCQLWCRAPVQSGPKPWSLARGKGILTLTPQPQECSPCTPYRDPRSRRACGCVASGELTLSETLESLPSDPATCLTATGRRTSHASGQGRRHAPRQVAEIVAARMSEHPDIAAVESRVRASSTSGSSRRRAPAGRCDVRASGAAFGRSDIGEGKKAQVEFVSANPVGPMHVGHAVGGARRFACRLLDHIGYRVEREFYVNIRAFRWTSSRSRSRRAISSCAAAKSSSPERLPGCVITDIAREISRRRRRLWADRPAAEREATSREGVCAGACAPQARVVRHGRRVRRVVLGAHAARIRRRRRSERDRARHGPLA